MALGTCPKFYPKIREIEPEQYAPGVRYLSHLIGSGRMPAFGATRRSRSDRPRSALPTDSRREIDAGSLPFRIATASQCSPASANGKASKNTNIGGGDEQ
jgi:hypothetical protein